MTGNSMRPIATVITSAVLYLGGITLECAGQQKSDPADERMLVLRVVSGNQGEGWEVSFLEASGDTIEVHGKIGDPSLLARIKSFAGVPIAVEPSPDASEKAVEETVAALDMAGIKTIHLLGSDFAYAGRLYHFASKERGITGPQLDIDREKLRQLAIALGVREKIAVGPDGEKRLGYFVFVDETGKLVKIEQLPPTPPFSAIENVLTGTRVLAAGRRGQEPVRSVVFVPVSLK